MSDETDKAFLEALEAINAASNAVWEVYDRNPNSWWLAQRGKDKYRDIKRLFWEVNEHLDAARDLLENDLHDLTKDDK